ncbi:MAG: hypothetical protein IT376_14805 [Polyangiaceae bacterium]|nr:hypothetical protein [Polyangiaceae bacterium]
MASDPKPTPPPTDLARVTATTASSVSPVKEYGLAVLKGAIGAIPFVGTAINEILFEARGRLKQARVEEFVRQVADCARAGWLMAMHADSVMGVSPANTLRAA